MPADGTAGSVSYGPAFDRRTNENSVGTCTANKDTRSRGRILVNSLNVILKHIDDDSPSSAQIKMGRARSGMADISRAGWHS